MAKEKVSRTGTFYAQKRVGYFTPGEEVDPAAYSDYKLKTLLDNGTLAKSPPKTEDDDEEVPPVDEADASLEPERRSGEATGQPNPDAPTPAVNAGQPVETPSRGRPRNNS